MSIRHITVYAIAMRFELVLAYIRVVHLVSEARAYAHDTLINFSALSDRPIRHTASSTKH